MPQYIKIYDDVINQETCRKLIARFDADARKRPDPQPDYSTRQYLPLSEVSDWQDAVLHLSLKANQTLSDFFSVPAGMEAAAIAEWTDDGFIMSHYRKGDACIMHVDGQCTELGRNGLRLATWLLYLNECESGETWFPLQNLKISPKPGRVVIFPPIHTHPHEVLPAGSDRYIIQSWIVDPYLVVNQQGE